MIVCDGLARETFAVDESLLHRFWSKVQKSDGCWEWTAALRVGYGAFRIGNRIWESHRVAWLLVHGHLPEKLFLCHHCDNRKCVRVDHLFLGTQLDNVRDMHQKGRVNQAEGEQMPNAVLNEQIVKEMWSLRRSKGWGRVRISRALRVSSVAVDSALRGKSWRRHYLNETKQGMVKNQQHC